ncbi:MAG: DUF4012 domain-containing protein [Bifidobacterium sp.]|nr:DUF4012 domain-containing protein [Bifidobacterium sp.]
MRQPQGRHLAATRPMRRRHVWPWVLLVIFVLLLAMAGVGAYAAKTMYGQAKEVKAHEQNAVTMLSGFSGTNDLNSLDQVSQKIPQVQSETQRANDIAHGKLWNLAAKAPYIGNDIKTVQGMTSAVDGITHDSVPQFLNVVNNLKGAQLSEGNGQINLQPILQAQPQMKAADESLKSQVAAFQKLPADKAKISQVSKAYTQTDAKLSGLAQKVDQISGTIQILPQFLGADKPQNYLVLSMTTSEARSSGGLIGSIGVMKTDQGKINIGDFKSNAEYIPYGQGGPTPDEKATFTDWGPEPMSMDIRDISASPDTARIAQMTQKIWTKTPWGKKQPIDGVITMDPVFLQALIRTSGNNVKLPSGQELDGNNTAEFLLNGIYKQYSNPMVQDVVFGTVAEQSVSSIFSNLNVNKMIALVQLTSSMGQQRHVSAYAFDGQVEQQFEESGVAAHTPNDEEKPTVGLYVNEQVASKLDWYVHRTSKITKTGGGTNGTQTYHVDYSMTNTMTNQELASTPDYVRGGIPPKGMPIEKVLIYAPAGGSLGEVSVNGKDSRKPNNTLNGVSLYANVVQIAPGDTVTFSFDVTTSSKAATGLALDQSPMGWEDPGITRVNY